MRLPIRMSSSCCCSRSRRVRARPFRVRRPSIGASQAFLTFGEGARTRSAAPVILQYAVALHMHHLRWELAAENLAGVQVSALVEQLALVTAVFAGPEE